MDLQQIKRLRPREHVLGRRDILIVVSLLSSQLTENITFLVYKYTVAQLSTCLCLIFKGLLLQVHQCYTAKRPKNDL